MQLRQRDISGNYPEKMGGTARIALLISYGAYFANAGQDGYKQREDSLAMVLF